MSEVQRAVEESRNSSVSMQNLSFAPWTPELSVRSGGRNARFEGVSRLTSSLVTESDLVHSQCEDSVHSAPANFNFAESLLDVSEGGSRGKGVGPAPSDPSDLIRQAMKMALQSASSAPAE